MTPKPEGKTKAWWGTLFVICGIAIVLVQIGILIFLLTHKLPIAAISMFLIGPLMLLLLGGIMRATIRNQKKPD